MSTTMKNTLATKTVSQGESRYGTPEPQIALRFPKGTSYRVVKAALHKLAAEIELATPAEAARGMALLETALWGDHSAAWGSSG